MADAPKIDPRTAPDVAGQVRYFLEKYTGRKFEQADGASAALVNVFARYAELLIERLNRVPEKNFLAFLDLLGASPTPPQPARAPLTFTLSEGSTVDAVVPKGTQVAAAPAEGESEPATFETESELVVTAAQLTSIFVRDPENDRSADRSSITRQMSPDGVAVFKLEQAELKTERILYIAHDALFGHPALNTLTLRFEIKDAGNVNALEVQWEIWDGLGWTLPDTISISDGTSNLTRSGEVTLTNLSALQRVTVNGQEKYWLRCRLKTPLPHTVGGQESKPPEFNPMRIKQATLQRNGLKVEQAIANDTLVDIAKGFSPFGERPKIGDAFYLALREPFSEPNAKVTLHVKLAKAGTAYDNLKLQWEFWNGQEWVNLNVSQKTAEELNSLDTGDATANFTKDGDIKFKLAGQPREATINGVESFWVRVRIVEGNYGKEAYYKPKDDKNLNAGFESIAATLSPPLVSSITVDYSVTKPTTPASPEVVLTYNDFEHEDVTSATAFMPFKPMPDANPTLLLGFELPAGRETFSQRKISLYADLYEYRYTPGNNPAPISISRDASPPGGQPQIAWEYSTKAGWAKLLIRDGTQSFTKSGLVEFFGPADFARRSEFGQERYWIRVVWKGGQYLFAPRLRRGLLNTTMAAQTTTIRDEVLGSSDGNRNQKFQTTRTPIIESERLEVREPEKPSALEQKRIKKETSEQGVTAADDDDSSEVWVRWTEVADFYASSARDRHYVVDHLTGEVRFGDGASGMIPPAGSGNIRLSEYKTGGGAAGNKPAGTITQLKTTVPYVESVINHLAASGGADAEALDSVMERAPRTARHRDRAVTIEDYEDLARLASPEVARARCVPLFDLENPSPVGQKDDKSGTVSLIIVPRSTATQPTPGIELIGRVRAYLDARRSPTSELIVVGPKYISVGVTVEVALTSMEGASEVEASVLAALARFLHPLTGGWDGAGWDFDRRPHKSDLYALIEGIEGVGHVQSLTVVPDEESDDFKTDRFLISSGQHRITLRLEEASAALPT